MQGALKIDKMIDKDNPYEAVDARGMLCRCIKCGEAIRHGDGFYCGDDYAQTPDGAMCLICFEEYVDQMKKTA